MEKIITMTKKITPKNPIFIAAWPGMGHVAIKAAVYLKDKLQAQHFAKLDTDKFSYQTDVVIHNSLIQMDRLPSGNFYYWENKFRKNDLIIFLSDIQPPPEKSEAYARAILEFTASLKVKMMFTFAAMLSAMSHTHTPKVWLAVTQQKLIDDFKGIDTRLMESGQVNGLNGIFLGYAKKKKMNGACLLGEIPFYAGQIENPRSSMAVLNTLTKYLGINLDLTELSLTAKAMEDEIEKLIEHIKETSGVDEEDRPITSDDIERMRNILSSQSQIPHSAKRQIEELFLQARDDLSCAVELKRKLDEWNAYKDYEDRFLELFKRGDERGN